jgi:hypothetical protein
MKSLSRRSFYLNRQWGEFPYSSYSVPISVVSEDHAIRFHSNAVLECPNSAQLDCTCYGTVDSTIVGKVFQFRLQNRPFVSEIASERRYSLVHYRFLIELIGSGVVPLSVSLSTKFVSDHKVAGFVGTAEMQI